MSVELLNIGCLNYMFHQPDNAFDLAIVDPPYGIGESMGKNNSRGSYRKAKYIGTKNTTGACIPSTYFAPKEWDNEKPEAAYFKELRRVSKNQIIWGGNYFIEHLYATSCFIVWDKNNGDTDFADCELAWTSFNSAVRKFKYTWNGMLQGDMKNKEERIHPTQKPVALYKWLLANYAKRICAHKHTEEYKHLCTECQKPFRILDTHLGSGSSAIAAHYGGFDFVGCEVDKDYYQAACKRFREQTAQLTISL